MKNKRRPKHDTQKPSAPGPENGPAPGASCAVPPWTVALLLVALVVLVYGQVGGFDFVNYDDTLYVTDNEHTQQGLTLANVKWAFTTGAASYFHPLTWLSHMLDCELFGMQPWGHHLTSLLFHVANSVLFFLIMNRMTRSFWPSALAAALFALHPLRVESVAWISERKDVLSMFFWLLGMGAYAWYAERPSLVRYVLVAVGFALGLMSKAMVVTFPFALLLLDYWPLGRFDGATGMGGYLRRGAKLAIEKLPLFAMTLAVSLLTLVMQTRGGVIASLEALPLAKRLANVPAAYAFYVVKAVWPSGLAVAYPYPLARPWWLICGALALLLAITGGVLWQARRRPYLPAGWFWFLGTLVPVIELVQAGSVPYADRYTYIPLIGLTMMAAWGVADVAATLRVPRPAVATVVGVVLAALALCALIQTSHWRDNTALYTHALRVTEGNHLAHKNLGVELSSQGRYQDAVNQYVKSALIKSNDADLHYNLGNALGELDQWDDAVRMYEKALEMDPGHVPTYYNLGNAYAKRGEYERAVELYTKALGHDPEHTGVVVNLGNTLAMLGRPQEAAEYFRKAIELAPEEEDPYINLGNALAQTNRQDEAVGYYRKAIAINPNHADAHSNLGVALMGLGRLDEAVEVFSQVVRLDPANAKARENLRLVQAQRQAQQKVGAASPDAPQQPK